MQVNRSNNVGFGSGTKVLALPPRFKDPETIDKELDDIARRFISSFAKEFDKKSISVIDSVAERAGLPKPSTNNDPHKKTLNGRKLYTKA